MKNAIECRFNKVYGFSKVIVFLQEIQTSDILLKREMYELHITVFYLVNSSGIFRRISAVGWILFNG